MKSYRGIALVSLSLGAAWRCGANMVQPQCWSGHFGEGQSKACCTCQHINLNCLASSPVTLLTTLSWLLLCAFSGWELIVCLRKIAKFSVRHNIYFILEVQVTCCGLIN
jgi:hypothetical protein